MHRPPPQLLPFVLVACCAAWASGCAGRQDLTDARDHGGAAGAPSAAARPDGAVAEAGSAGTSAVTPGGSAEAARYPNGCAPNPPGEGGPDAGEEIVACGLSDSVILAGVDAEGIAFFEGAGRDDLRRLDRASGAVGTIATGVGASYPYATRGGRFYFQGELSLLSLDLRTGERRRHGRVLGLHALVVGDQHAYMRAYAREEDEASCGELTCDLNYRASTLTTSEENIPVYNRHETSPVAIDGSFLYGLRYPRALVRQSLEGGPSEPITTLPPAKVGDEGTPTAWTIAGGKLYLSRNAPKGGTHILVQRDVLADAATEQVVATIADGDCDCPPRELRVHGDLLIVDLGFGRDIIAVPLTAPQEARRLFGRKRSDPTVIVDATHVYAAFARGGVETPIEGYISRVPRRLPTTEAP